MPVSGSFCLEPLPQGPSQVRREYHGYMSLRTALRSRLRLHMIRPLPNAAAQFCVLSNAKGLFALLGQAIHSGLHLHCLLQLMNRQLSGNFLAYAPPAVVSVQLHCEHYGISEPVEVGPLFGPIAYRGSSYSWLCNGQPIDLGQIGGLGAYFEQGMPEVVISAKTEGKATDDVDGVPIDAKVWFLKIHQCGEALLRHGPMLPPGALQLVGAANGLICDVPLPIPVPSLLPPVPDWTCRVFSYPDRSMPSTGDYSILWLNRHGRLAGSAEFFEDGRRPVYWELMGPGPE